MATIDDIKRDVDEIKSVLEEIKKLLSPGSSSAGTPILPPSGTYFRVDAEMISPEVRRTLEHRAGSFLIIPLSTGER